MTISNRSVKRLMRESLPGTPLSDGAVALLKDYLIKQAQRLTIYASMIQSSENEMRKSIGDRPRKRLSRRSLQSAIDNKYPGVMTRNGNSKS